jgi:hypothetical protein
MNNIFKMLMSLLQVWVPRVRSVEGDRAHSRHPTPTLTIFATHDLRRNTFNQERWAPWGWRRNGAETCSSINILTLHCMNFQKYNKKIHMIKYIQKHNKYYTKITLLTIFQILMKICICITYDTSRLLSTFTLYGYVSHMIKHVYWQPLSVAHCSVSYRLYPISREAEPFP